MEFYEVTVKDYRIINEILEENYNFSLNDYATIYVRRVLAKIINSGIAKNLQDLHIKLYEKSIEKEELMSFFWVETTELFRDPSVWRFLAKFLKKKKEILKTRIWFPLCVDRMELFSLLILLKVLGLEKTVEVIVNIPIGKYFNEVGSNFVVPYKLMEVSEGNFRRLELKTPFVLEDFFENNGDFYSIKTSFSTAVKYIKGLETQKPKRSVNVIMYRNRMLYYTLSKSIDIVDTLSESLLHGGLLFIGVNERLLVYNENMFSAIDVNDGIYKRK